MISMLPPALPVSTSRPYAPLFGNHVMFHLMFLDCFLVHHFVVMSECKVRLGNEERRLVVTGK